MDKWKDLAMRAIDCVHDAERETNWGQPTFGPSVWEGLRQEQNDLLATASSDELTLREHVTHLLYAIDRGYFGDVIGLRDSAFVTPLRTFVDRAREQRS